MINRNFQTKFIAILITVFYLLETTVGFSSAPVSNSHLWDNLFSSTRPASLPPAVRIELRSLKEELVRSELRSVADPKIARFSQTEVDLMNRRIEAIETAYPHLSLKAKEVLLYPSFLLTFLGIKPFYLATTTGRAEKEPSPLLLKQELEAIEGMDDLIHGQIVFTPSFALNIDEVARELIKRKEFLKKMKVFRPEDEETLKLIESNLSENMGKFGALLQTLLRNRFSDHSPEHDAMLGVLFGYPDSAIEAVAHHFSKTQLADFPFRDINLRFIPGANGEMDPDSRQYLARVAIALLYAYAAIREFKGFGELARAMKLPEAVLLADRPVLSAQAKSELRDSRRELLLRVLGGERADPDRLIEAARRLGLDVRPSEGVLLHPLYVLHDMAVKKVINPRNRLQRALYKGAGADISNFLLSTNIPNVDFEAHYHGLTVEDLKSIKAMRVDSNGFVSLVARYLAGKFSSGYGMINSFDSDDWEELLITKSGVVSALAAELFAMGVNFKTIEVDQDERGYPRLSFEWDYLGGRLKRYRISFIDYGDGSKKPKYLDGYDVYYQRAGQDMAVHYSAQDSYIIDVYDRVAPGGYLVTDDYGVWGETYQSYSDYFPLILEKKLVPVQASVLDSIIKLRRDFFRGEISEPRLRYGWDVTIRQKPKDSKRSELRLAATHPYKLESYVSRPLSVLNSYYNLFSDLDPRRNEPLKILMIGVGRGVAATELAMRYPNFKITAINKEKGLWDDREAEKAVRAPFLVQKRPFPQASFDAARKSIDLKIFDLESAQNRIQQLGKEEFDVVIVEYGVLQYMKDRVRVIETVFNEHVKAGGLYMFEFPDETTFNDLTDFNVADEVYRVFQQSAEVVMSRYREEIKVRKLAGRPGIKIPLRLTGAYRRNGGDEPDDIRSYYSMDQQSSSADSRSELRDGIEPISSATESMRAILTHLAPAIANQKFMSVFSESNISPLTDLEKKALAELVRDRWHTTTEAAERLGVERSRYNRLKMTVLRKMSLFYESKIWEQPVNPDDQSIFSLGKGSPAESVILAHLFYARLFTIFQLAQLTERELGLQKGIGKSAVEIIKKWLAEKGLTLKEKSDVRSELRDADVNQIIQDLGGTEAAMNAISALSEAIGTPVAQGDLVSPQNPELSRFVSGLIRKSGIPIEKQDAALQLLQVTPLSKAKEFSVNQLRKVKRSSKIATGATKKVVAKAEELIRLFGFQTSAFENVIPYEDGKGLDRILAEAIAFIYPNADVTDAQVNEIRNYFVVEELASDAINNVIGWSPVGKEIRERFNETSAQDTERARQIIRGNDPSPAVLGLLDLMSRLKVAVAQKKVSQADAKREAAANPDILTKKVVTGINYDYGARLFPIGSRDAHIFAGVPIDDNIREALIHELVEVGIVIPHFLSINQTHHRYSTAFYNVLVAGAYSDFLTEAWIFKNAEQYQLTGNEKARNAELATYQMMRMIMNESEGKGIDRALRKGTPHEKEFEFYKSRFLQLLQTVIQMRGRVMQLGTAAAMMVNDMSIDDQVRNQFFIKLFEQFIKMVEAGPSELNLLLRGLPSAEPKRSELRSPSTDVTDIRASVRGINKVRMEALLRFLLRKHPIKTDLTVKDNIYPFIKEIDQAIGDISLFPNTKRISDVNFPHIAIEQLLHLAAQEGYIQYVSRSRQRIYSFQLLEKAQQAFASESTRDTKKPYESARELQMDGVLKYLTKHYKRGEKFSAHLPPVEIDKEIDYANYRRRIVKLADAAWPWVTIGIIISYAAAKGYIQKTEKRGVFELLEKAFEEYGKRPELRDSVIAGMNRNPIVTVELRPSLPKNADIQGLSKFIFTHYTFELEEKLRIMEQLKDRIGAALSEILFPDAPSHEEGKTWTIAPRGKGGFFSTITQFRFSYGGVRKFAAVSIPNGVGFQNDVVRHDLELQTYFHRIGRNRFHPQLLAHSAPISFTFVNQAMMVLNGNLVMPFLNALVLEYGHLVVDLFTAFNNLAMQRKIVPRQDRLSIGVLEWLENSTEIHFSGKVNGTQPLLWEVSEDGVTHFSKLKDPISVAVRIPAILTYFYEPEVEGGTTISNVLPNSGDFVLVQDPKTGEEEVNLITMRRLKSNVGIPEFIDGLIHLFALDENKSAEELREGVAAKPLAMVGLPVSNPAIAFFGLEAGLVDLHGEVEGKRLVREWLKIYKESKISIPYRSFVDKFLNGSLKLDTDFSKFGFRVHALTRSELRHEIADANGAQIFELVLDENKSAEEQLKTAAIPEGKPVVFRVIPRTRAQRDYLKLLEFKPLASSSDTVRALIVSAIRSRKLLNIEKINNDILRLAFSAPISIGNSKFTSLNLTMRDPKRHFHHLSQRFNRFIDNRSDWSNTDSINAFLSYLGSDLALIEEVFGLQDEETKSVVAELLEWDQGALLVSENRQEETIKRLKDEARERSQREHEERRRELAEQLAAERAAWEAEKLQAREAKRQIQLEENRLNQIPRFIDSLVERFREFVRHEGRIPLDLSELLEAARKISPVFISAMSPENLAAANTETVNQFLAEINQKVLMPNGHILGLFAVNQSLSEVFYATIEPGEPEEIEYLGEKIPIVPVKKRKGALDMGGIVIDGTIYFDPKTAGLDAVSFYPLLIGGPLTKNESVVRLNEKMEELGIHNPGAYGQYFGTNRARYYWIQRAKDFKFARRVAHAQGASIAEWNWNDEMDWFERALLRPDSKFKDSIAREFKGQDKSVVRYYTHRLTEIADQVGGVIMEMENYLKSDDPKSQDLAYAAFLDFVSFHMMKADFQYNRRRDLSFVEGMLHFPSRMIMNAFYDLEPGKIENLRGLIAFVESGPETPAERSLALMKRIFALDFYSDEERARILSIKEVNQTEARSELRRAGQLGTIRDESPTGFRSELRNKTFSPDVVHSPIYGPDVYAALLGTSAKMAASMIEFKLTQIAVDPLYVMEDFLGITNGRELRLGGLSSCAAAALVGAGGDWMLLAHHTDAVERDRKGELTAERYQGVARALTEKTGIAVDLSKAIGTILVPELLPSVTFDSLTPAQKINLIHIVKMAISRQYHVSVEDLERTIRDPNSRWTELLVSMLPARFKILQADEENSKRIRNAARDGVVRIFKKLGVRQISVDTHFAWWKNPISLIADKTRAVVKASGLPGNSGPLRVLETKTSSVRSDSRSELRHVPYFTAVLSAEQIQNLSVIKSLRELLEYHGYETRLKIETVDDAVYAQLISVQIGRKLPGWNLPLLKKIDDLLSDAIVQTKGQRVVVQVDNDLDWMFPRGRLPKDALGDSGKDKPLIYMPVFDKFIAAITFIPAAVLAIAMIPLVKLATKEPVFLIQRRIGYLGKPFYVYKFRTLEKNGEAIKLFGFIKLGSILRHSGLDEILQWVNIWKGEMAFFGPRPRVEWELTPEYQQTLLTRLPGFFSMHKALVGPGRALQGKEIDEVLKWNQYEINHWSVLLMAKIVALSAVAALKGLIRGAIGENQVVPMSSMAQQSERRSELRHLSPAPILAISEVTSDSQNRMPVLSEKLLKNSDSRIDWSAPDDTLIHSRVDSILRRDGSMILHLVPMQSERDARVRLDALDIEGDVPQMPHTGTFGRIMMKQVMYQNEPAILIEEIHASRGFHYLSDDLRKRYREWISQTIRYVATVASESGFRHVIVNSNETIREENPHRPQDRPGYSSISDKSLYEHYIRPFRGKADWEKIEISDGSPAQKRKYWYSPLNQLVRRDAKSELRNLKQKKFETKPPIVESYPEKSEVALVVSDVAFDQEGRSRILFDRVGNIVFADGIPQTFPNMPLVDAYKRDLRQLVETYQAAHPTKEILAILPNGNLGFNDWFVGVADGKVYLSASEPLDRHYEMLTTDRNGNVKVMTLKFVNKAGVSGIFDTSDKDVSHEISYALYGQRIVKDGNVNLGEITDQFDDLRHLFRFPLFQHGDDQIHLGFSDGTGELYRDYNRIRKAFEGQAIELSLRPLLERGFSLYDIEQTFIEWGYLNQSMGKDSAGLEAGGFLIKGDTIIVRLLPGIHPHSLFGITNEGKLLTAVVQGETHYRGASLHELAEQLIRQGARDIFLWANGKDSKVINQTLVVEAKDVRKQFLETVLIVRNRVGFPPIGHAQSRTEDVMAKAMRDLSTGPVRAEFERAMSVGDKIRQTESVGLAYDHRFMSEGYAPVIGAYAKLRGEPVVLVWAMDFELDEIRNMNRALGPIEFDGKKIDPIIPAHDPQEAAAILKRLQKTPIYIVPEGAGVSPLWQSIFSQVVEFSDAQMKRLALSVQPLLEAIQASKAAQDLVAQMA